MNDRMKVCMNERMTVVCMFYYLNGNKHIKEEKKLFGLGRWRKATVLANVSGVLSRHAMESVQFRQVSLHSSCWTGKSLFNYMAMPWDTQKCLK
jgi:hypothetical protein